MTDKTASLAAGFAVDALLSGAGRKAGVTDASAADDVALHVLAAELAARADQFTFIGRNRAQRWLIEVLVKRLRLAEYRTRFPEIDSRIIARPIVLIGPPRTGTTFLHRLLAEDPQSRSPRLWEVMQAPPREPEFRAEAAYFERDYRVAMARGYVDKRGRFSRHVAAAHPTDANAPEECYGLLETSLRSHSFLFLGPLRGYLDWLEHCSAEDWRTVYELYGAQLRLLDWWWSRPYWVLKTPFHLWAMDALLAVLPDALIVQQHRDPLPCMSSFCGLVAASYEPVLQSVDRADIGELALTHMERALARAADARGTLAAEHFVDVSYEALVSDPMAVVARIYAAAGRELSAAGRTAMEAYLAAQRAHRAAHPPPTAERDPLAAYGLDAQRVKAAFAPYDAFCHGRVSTPPP